MEQEITRPSLFDCVVWAHDRQAFGALRCYTFNRLTRLFSSYHPSCVYCFTGVTGAIHGIAIAYMDSATNVRIPYIITNRRPEMIATAVEKFTREFPDAQTFSFSRRGKEYTVSVSHLLRLFKFNIR